MPSLLKTSDAKWRTVNVYFPGMLRSYASDVGRFLAFYGAISSRTFYRVNHIDTIDEAILSSSILKSADICSSSDFSLFPSYRPLFGGYPHLFSESTNM